MCARGCHGDIDAAARAQEHQQTASRDGGAGPRGDEASVRQRGGVSSESRLANGNAVLCDITTSVANGNVLPCDIITTTAANKQQLYSKLRPQRGRVTALLSTMPGWRTGTHQPHPGSVMKTRR